MGQSSCPGSENAHSGSILSIIAQSCLDRNTGNNCLHVHLQHTNHPYLHLLMLNISITVKHAKKKKKPHWTHSTLQTSPAHFSWEGRKPRGNHAVVAVSFPSDCCLWSLLPDQVSGELFSLSLCVHSRSPGLAPPSCTLENKSHSPWWVRHQRMLWTGVTH